MSIPIIQNGDTTKPVGKFEDGKMKFVKGVRRKDIESITPIYTIEDRKHKMTHDGSIREIEVYAFSVSFGY